MQAKVTLLKIWTLNFIDSVLNLDTVLSKISDTRQIMFLKASKQLKNSLKKTSNYVYLRSVIDAKQIAESLDFDTNFPIIKTINRERSSLENLIIRPSMTQNSILGSISFSTLLIVISLLKEV